MTRDDVLDFIQIEEGGVADVGDGKGTTHFGQTEQWLTEWGFAVPNTPGQARGNWQKWAEAIGLDVLVEAHPRLGLAVIDFAVHSGHPTAIKALQAAMGLTADGLLGPVSKHAIAMLSAESAEKIRLLVIAARLKFLGRIIADKPEKHAKFAAGWLARIGRVLTA